MKAVEEYFIRYLEGHDKQFVIPVYQRNYDWKREQCEQLFNDILNIIHRKQESYFIGSIVSIHSDKPGVREYVVIDGQQRITTITLMLLAIYNMLCSGEVKTDNSTLKDEILDEYIVNKHSKDKKRIKLKPIKDDNKAFLRLFDDCSPDGHIPYSNITENYRFFIDCIKTTISNNITVDEIYEAIKRLQIVDIKLERNTDNPQLIFESLNSTGKDLDEADLIRNFILMDKEPEKQEEFYDKFWHPIEKNTHYKVGDFIRDYLTYSHSKTPRKDKVYVEFKNHVQENINAPDELEPFLEELLQFSRFYRGILSSDTSNDDVNRILRWINRLQITVSYPFLLDVFYAWEEKIIDSETTAEILTVIESFIVRRMICGVPTSSLNKIFPVLGRNIRKAENFEENYFDIFKYFITAGLSSSRFPDDEDFRKEITERDVYKLNRKNRIHLFERLENHNNKVKIDVESMIENKKDGLTFEHIMPQNLTKDWKKDLGDNHDSIHQKYLNTIGNITLTAYNSSLSNKRFVEKLDAKNGFREKGHLWLNNSLVKLNQWTEDEIRDRANLLADRSMEIWDFPQSNYVPPQKEDEEIYLDEDYDFTGKKPKSFSFLDQSYTVSTWQDVYRKTVQIFYELEPVRLASLIDEPEHRRYLGRTEDSHNDSWKLSDGIHLNVRLSAQYIINIIKGLFAEFNLEESEFTITLYENIKSDDD